jgi:hypothetical protein
MTLDTQVVAPHIRNMVSRHWVARELVVLHSKVETEARLPLGAKQVAAAVAAVLAVLVNQEVLIPTEEWGYLATSLAQLFSMAVVVAVLV